MQKVIIIGCPGSGKSTLSIKLGEKTGLPVIHLDKLFWRSGWTHVSKEEFDRLLQIELNNNQWIMDGNYGRTIPLRMAACDTVIFLDFSTLTCLLGVVKRVIANYGTTRADMGEDCPERFDWDFLKYVLNFRKNERHKILRAIQDNRDKKIIILKFRKQVTAMIEHL